MLRLTTLGALRLQSDDTSGSPLGAAATHRRRLALLAALAVAGDHGISRDKLLLLFWPDSDTDSARNALRQALHALRRDLNADSVFLGSTDLRLNPEVIGSDVEDFESAVGSGDHERAIGLYTGPFLDGVHIEGADEFDQWVEAERGRLLRRWWESIEIAARGADAQRAFTRAASLWQRRAASEPLNTRVLLELIRALAKSGDRAGALQQASAHQRLLQTELDVQAPRELMELVREIRSGSAPDAVASPPSVTTDPTAHAAAPPAIDAAPHGGQPSRLRVARALRWAAVIIVASASVLGARRLWLGSDVPRASGRNVIAVLPFDTRGADRSLDYLQEGMIDLLTPELSVGTAERPASPRAVLSTWRPAAGSTPLVPAQVPRLARQLGVERVVIGQVLGTSQHMTVRAYVLDVTTQRRESEATVTGPADSLASLADHLSAALISGAGDTPRARASLLASVPLPALRAYVEGQAAYRGGQYEEAIRLFNHALAYDSAFAYAALGLAAASTGDPAGYGGLLPRAVGLAWAARDHLAASDRAYLVGIAGPRYPHQSSTTEYLRAWQDATAQAAQYPESWFGLGDQFFHSGQILGLPHPIASARVAFQRAVELNPDFSPAVEHLLEVAIREKDSSSVRRLAASYRAIDSSGPMAQFVRWRVAQALHDTTALRRIVSAFDTMPMLTLRWVIEAAQYDGAGMSDATRALLARQRRSGTIAERVETALARHSLALNRGRPIEAAAIELDLAELEPDDYLDLRFPILAALYGDGDSTAAAVAARQMSRHFMIETAIDPTATQTARDEAREALCVLGQWRRATDPAFAAQVSSLLRKWAPQSAATAEMLFCAVLLEPPGATLQARIAQADTLDSLVRTGENLRRAGLYAPLATARQFDAAGETARALTAVRRRGYFGRWPYYLATMLREEANYAFALSDTNTAICALEHYRALRVDPEPSMIAAVSDARATAVRLERGRHAATCVR